MANAISTLPDQQLAVLNDTYRKAVARKRLKVTLAAVVFFAALIVAAIGAEVNLRTLFSYFGNFVSYFDRIFTLEDGTRVWTNFGEWFWGWQKWLKMLGETILISYVGTLIGAVLAFVLNFFAALIVAAIGAEVNLRTLFSYFGNFVSYFDRILTLEDGARVWTNFGEWFWGWQKWLKMLGETILISYVGTLAGAVLAFVLNFFAAQNTSPAPWLRFVIRRLLEFARTVPGIVFALIFVIAFGLGPMGGVLAIAVHSAGALGKLFSEIVENADMKPVEGVRSTGASWLSCMRFAVLPQVTAGYASYALLRFEINVREASVMGFVGAGGIGQELVVAIRKFYYSDVSAILVTIIVTVFVIDITTGWLRGKLFGTEARA